MGAAEKTLGAPGLVVKLSGRVEAGLRRARLGGFAPDLRVSDAMTTEMVTASPGDTLREAARAMTDRDVAAAVVESAEPGIVTARDVLEFVSAGHDPDAERVADHSSPRARSTSPRTPLGEAARTMIDGGFRHLIVSDAGRTTGILAMRDVVRCWVDERAIPREVIPIRKSMNTDFLRVDVTDSVQRTARSMSERRAAAAVVEPTEDRPYPGVFTEREVLHSLREGHDLASERLAGHLAARMTFSAPGWSLKQAAEAMRKGDFQHIVVVDRYEIRGLISMRDIVRRWAEAR